MNTISTGITLDDSAQGFVIPALGTPIGGGFFVDAFNLNGIAHGIIVAPKAEGRYPDDIAWNGSNKSVEGATSYFDGLANTKAMAAAGSKLAQWMLDLRIGEKDDWHLAAQDVKEIIYRKLKPTTAKNSLWGRSGINLSALTYPYTSDSPAQTAITLFQEGGAEAFDEVYYWTSTQHAAGSGYAWYQDFGNGSQNGYYEDIRLRARAVRIEPLSNLVL